MKSAIWHTAAHYTPSRFGVDAVIVIECCAAALIALAFSWIEFLTQ
jgi:hypothetical protein